LNTALLLIDIQNDYFQHGRSELFHAEEAGVNAARVLDLFRREGLTVIHVQHINIREGATFFLPDTQGVQFYSMVTPKQEESVVIKNTPNSFYNTKLKETLDKLEIEQLVICGMMTHMCIDTTVRAAKDYGYKVTLIGDACATKDLVGSEGVIDARTVHNTFIAALNGMFASIVNSEEYVAVKSNSCTH
jgi:nicotinamidase-related amidase